MAKRKIITEKEKNELKSTAYDILTNILRKFLPKLNKSQYPYIKWKFGGCSACVWAKSKLIEINFYSFRKRDLFGKRILLIHEFLHTTGQNHNSKKNYNTSIDFYSIMIYKEIYGEDQAFLEMKESTMYSIKELRQIVPLLNQRKFDKEGFIIPKKPRKKPKILKIPVTNGDV